VTVLRPLLVAVGTAAVATAAVLTVQGVAFADHDGDRPGGAPGEPVSDAPGAEDETIEAGRELYLVGCVSCHGPEGAGVATAAGDFRGPSLLGSGEAAAYYYLSTGRMPLANAEEQPARKKPAYTPSEIEALVAYVGSLGDGPEVPDVGPAGADIAEGGVLYRSNCAPCHSAAGIGGALSYGRAAPSVHPSTPLEIAAAIRVGPGQMPAFSEGALSDRDLDDIVAYVEYLDSPENPGGASLGGAGPIPEGFVSWLFGVGALLAATLWIGTRAPVRGRGSPRP